MRNRICEANQHTINQRHYDHAAHDRACRFRRLQKVGISTLAKFVVNELSYASGQRLSAAIKEEQREDGDCNNHRVMQNELAERSRPAKQRCGLGTMQPAGCSTRSPQYRIPLLEHP